MKYSVISYLIKEGFKSVLSYGGTGAGYIDLKYNPAGKTGTSQSFIDTNFDGKIDKEKIEKEIVYGKNRCNRKCQYGYYTLFKR